ncbi:MAG TPA: tRNA (N(6)-L-threonylcarbamoyladenosine(37)-C(2))-methylthiotransferase MtaB, partial [Pseudolabrys sp.]
IVKERAKRLRAFGAAMLRDHLDAQVGQTRRLLSERGGIARTEQFTPVSLAAPIAPGLLIDRVVSGPDGRTLRAA